MNLSQLSALAGMVGPVLFVAVFTLEGWLRSGYKPLAMHVSALSLGPGGWIRIANFVFFWYPAAFVCADSKQFIFMQEFFR